MNRVLIVDDNAESLYFLEILLKTHGFEVMKAENGAVALEAARRSPPDLIVTDILMPVMDGYALCRRCQEEERLRHIPFVFYTATYTRPEDRALGLDLGADRFILKPQEPEVLMGIFRELLEGGRRPQSLLNVSLEEEMEFLRRHNQALFHKLEKKMRDVEAAHRQLQDKEAAARKEERFLDSILENIPDMIFVKEAKTLKFVRFNRAGEKLLGLSREELIGKSDYDFFPREQADFFTAKDREVLAAGKLLDIPEEPLQSRSLGERILHTQKIPILNEEGEAIYLLGISEDITDRKQAEKQMLRSEEKYRQIYENAVEGIYQTTPEGRYLSMNPAFFRMFGYDSREEMIAAVTDIGRQLYVNPADRERLKKLLTEKGEVQDFIAQVYRRDGSKFWISINAHTVKDREGRILYYEGTNEDITPRMQAEEDLRRAEADYRTIFEGVQDGIFRSTPAGAFLMANPAMARMLGYDSPEELIAQVTDVARQLYVYPEDREKILRLIDRQGFVKDFEVQQRRKDGSLIWVSLTFQAARDERGDIRWYEGISKDITERKLSMERLIKSLEATVQAMAVTVETRDPYTAGHQRRVAELACAIAEEMNLSCEQINTVRMASIIHDLGKISVPAEILSMPRKLSDIEFSLVKNHARSGFDILKDIDFPWPIAEIILQHHERLDGSGYPRGLKGDELLVEAKILSVADVVESMISYRPYRPALPLEEGLAEIEKNRGIRYDAEVVDACLRLFREKGFRLAQ
ncbi:MAG TPA: PAS domain S-box protein [Syntrophales bacterium]|nr:PAS domain S-box protein [Syntrophales bacterium]